MAAKVKVLMSDKQAKFWKAFLAMLEELSPKEAADEDEDDDNSDESDEDGDDGSVEEDDDAGTDEEDSDGEDDDVDDGEEDEKPAGKKSAKGKKPVGPTLADVMNAFKKLAKTTGGKKSGIAILKKLKVKAPSEIDEDQFPQVLKLLKAAGAK